LNVNQVEFPGLQRATSVKLQKGKVLAIDEVLKLLLKELEGMISGLEDMELGKIKAAYEALLFRRDKPSTFMVAGDLTFTAYIRGISDSGKLIIEVEDGILREYALKDIRLLY
ncbi:MAG: biotin--[acetyl-CoA-carboxylase] ligase, partial [Eudoraea sp.]|nr:biotin--[acetyl-CoA-carboxylase] ligase [Eudoraea sp.]